MEKQTLAGLKLLIVEDEFLIAMDVEQLCRDCGATETLIVGTAAELAARAAEAEAFDAAILDVMIEGQSTLDFARSLQKRGVPFIFATGYSERNDVFSAFPSARVVGKPFAGEELIAAIVSVLGSAGGAAAAM